VEDEGPLIRMNSQPAQTRRRNRGQENGKFVGCRVRGMIALVWVEVGSGAAAANERPGFVERGQQAVQGDDLGAREAEIQGANCGLGCASKCL